MVFRTLGKFQKNLSNDDHCIDSVVSSSFGDTNKTLQSFDPKNVCKP